MNPSSTQSDPPAGDLGSLLFASDRELLLFSGSSDGCVRLHTQSLQHLGRAVAGDGPAGLVQQGLMHLQETLHEVDLLGVTCLAVRASAGTQPQQLPSETQAGKRVSAYCYYGSQYNQSVTFILTYHITMS